MKPKRRAGSRESVGDSKRINDFIFKTFSRLDEDSDLSHALQFVVEELARVLDAAHLFLFRHDACKEELRLYLSLVDGKMRWGLAGAELPLWENPFPDKITPAWQIMCESGGLFTPDMCTIPPEQFAWPGSFEYARRFELSDIAHIVLFAGGKPVGSIGLGFRNRKKLKLTDKPFIEAVARQAGMIVRMLDLAEAAKSAAIISEHERAVRERALELEEANITLRNALVRLGQIDDLPQFLEALLVEVLRTAGAHTGAVVLIEGEPPNDFAHHIALIDRRGIVPLEVKRSEGLERPPFNDALRAFAARIDQADEASGSDPEDEMYSEGFREFHRSQGNRFIRLLALRAKGRMIGWLGLGFAEKNSIANERLNLLRLLANQMTMAVEMKRLSDGAHQAAIAREQEQAARQRAMELEATNAILTMRDKLLKLVAEASRELIQAPDLIAGIHSLLRRMGESTQLSRVLLYLQRKTVNNGSEHYIVTEWCAPGIADHRSLGIEVIPDSIVKPFLEWVKNQSGFWLDMQKVEEPMRSTFAPLKIISAGCAPVMVGGEHVGVIAFDDCTTLRGDDFAHVDAFLAVANFIGAALQRDQSQKALLAEQHARASAEARALHEREAAIFQERARFAGQIHDTLAQGFTGTLLHLEALRVRAARGEHATVKELDNVRKIAALGLAEARRSALAIRPLALDGRDIPTALQQLAERSAVPGLIDCHWSLSGLPRPIPPIADEALLNIAHEAVSNAIRHADAANIQITLDFADDGLSLRVCDNGIGFDASESRQRGHTFGLSSMRERAFAAGGELKVVSKHGKGTTVTVHLRNV